jgi:hypothetical protein
LYILIFKFLTADEKTEGSGMNGYQRHQSLKSFQSHRLNFGPYKITICTSTL